MSIQTEPTPNPATLKFIPGKTVLGDGTVDFRDKSEAIASPLARRLFGVDGVTGYSWGRLHLRHQERRRRVAAHQARHPRRHHGALHVGRADRRRR